MKNEKLFRAFTDIDEALVEEADPDKAQASTRKDTPKEKKPFFAGWKKWAIPLVAACLLVAIVLPIVPMLFNAGSKDAENGTGNGVNKNPQYSLMTPEEGVLVDCKEPASGPEESFPDISGEDYTEIIENAFVKALENSNSYFSIHANTASYTNLRSLIRQGIVEIPKNAVRVEEMLNYFSYDYTTPDDGSILSLTASLFDNPYNSETKLLTIGLAAEQVALSSVENNIVFLIDTSGSMYSPDKLPLVQEAFSLLTENLNDTDRVSIVTYAGGDTVVLSGAYGYEKAKILAAIADLTAGGSTAGSKGIETAYRLASEYFINGGNNRVVLMTDGDFNVGISTTDGLKNFIAEKRETGVYFSVYGVGRGNLQSAIMETLAQNGNGTYGYLDSVKEARRALVEEIGGSMITVAKDVKAGITFNAEYIDSYRLIGYENNLLTEEEFNASETDAGELGSGHTVTVVYEVKLTDKTFAENEAIADVKIRYKPTENSATEEVLDQELTLPVATSVYHKVMTAQDAFIASVVEFALLLRDSAYKGDADLDALVSRLDALDLSDDELKEEFRSLVKFYQEKAE